MIKLRQAVLLLCVEHAALHDVILSSLVMLSVEEEVQRTAALLDTVIDKTHHLQIPDTTQVSTIDTSSWSVYCASVSGVLCCNA